MMKQPGCTSHNPGAKKWCPHAKDEGFRELQPDLVDGKLFFCMLAVPTTIGDQLSKALIFDVYTLKLI